MFIVDAQVHIWGENTPERPWPQGRSRPHRPQAFTRDDLLREMDAAGVARAVLVPPSWEGDRNDLGLAAAAAYPDRFAVMGRPPLMPAPLTQWRRQRGMLGLRVTSNVAEAQTLFADPTAWLWAEADRNRLPVMVSAPGMLPRIDAIAERHPGIRFVVDHLGLRRDEKDAAAFADLPQLLALARRPNIAVKASALPAYSSEAYPYRGLHSYLRQVFDAFGPTRMFWGTDLTRLPCSYGQAIAMFVEELPWLASADLEWVMGRGVCEWLVWPLPGEYREYA
ncbi:MAG TPA: amidohydrolase family protein [Stellaceae bacterium]|nr:amidohydrolase family protein [Stellaceae bacterium]